MSELGYLQHDILAMFFLILSQYLKLVLLM
jgi:hypothetical protein